MSCVPGGAWNFKRGLGLRAQLGEERIALELVAERRRRAVPGIDDRLRREARRRARGSSRAACPSRRTGGRSGRPSPRRARRPRRGSRPRDRRGGRASGRGREGPRTRCRPRRSSRRRGAVSTGAPCGRPRPHRASGPFERGPLVLGHVDGRAGSLGEVGDAAEVIPVRVRDQDRRAARAQAGELEAQGRGVAARVDDGGLGAVPRRGTT